MEVPKFAAAGWCISMGKSQTNSWMLTGGSPMTQESPSPVPWSNGIFGNGTQQSIKSWFFANVIIFLNHGDPILMVYHFPDFFLPFGHMSKKHVANGGVLFQFPGKCRILQKEYTKGTEQGLYNTNHQCIYICIRIYNRILFQDIT